MIRSRLFTQVATSESALRAGLQQFGRETKAQLAEAKQKQQELLNAVKRNKAKIDQLEGVLTKNEAAMRNVVKEESRIALQQREAQTGRQIHGCYLEPDPSYVVSSKP